MWTRAELKSNAKAVLKRNYWIPFLLCLILTFLGGGFFEGSKPQLNFTFNNFNLNVGLPSGGPVWMLFASFGILFLIIGIVFSFFVINPLYVGRARYFINNVQADAKMGDMFNVFQDPNYWNIVKIMAIRDVKTFLWTLCLIIPGIYKSYEYAMIPNILADDSSLSVQDAFSITKEMTDNQKWNMFVLSLSFIGWYILGSILIIGKFFVDPYFEATQIELYIKFKERIGVQ